MRRVSAALAATAATVALLSACGGGDDDGAAAQEVASLATDAPAADQPDATDATEGTDPTGGTATPGGTTPDGTTPADGSAPPVSAPTDPEEAMLAYTECMRDHGIDMPDPEIGENGEVTMGLQIKPGQEEEMEEAQEACRYLMESAVPEGEIDPEEQAEMREEMLEYTECMREHGIDMADPVFGDNGTVMMQAGSADSAPDQGGGPPDFEDEEFQAAHEECGGDDGGFVTNVDEDS